MLDGEGFDKRRMVTALRKLPNAFEFTQEGVLFRPIIEVKYTTPPGCMIGEKYIWLSKTPKCTASDRFAAERSEVTFKRGGVIFFALSQQHVIATGALREDEMFSKGAALHHGDDLKPQTLDLSIWLCIQRMIFPKDIIPMQYLHLVHVAGDRPARNDDDPGHVSQGEDRFRCRMVASKASPHALEAALRMSMNGIAKGLFKECDLELLFETGRFLDTVAFPLNGDVLLLGGHIRILPEQCWLKLDSASVPSTTLLSANFDTCVPILVEQSINSGSVETSRLSATSSLVAVAVGLCAAVFAE